MSRTGIIVRPTRSASRIEGIAQDILFEDQQIETIVLAPGQIVADVLRERGEERDYIVVPRSRFL